MTVISDRPIGGDKAPIAAIVIGWLGVAPFVLGAIAPLVMTDVRRAAFVALATGVYSALVLSFLGGIRWGMAMGPLYGSERSLGFVMSMLAPLAAWIALIIPRVEGLAVLIAAFLLQVWLDVRSVGEGRAPVWFAPFRIRLTAAAVVALVVTAIAEMAVLGR